MSDKIYLKEITLPIIETGEDETYFFVQTDDGLDTPGDAADSKETGDRLNSLKQVLSNTTGSLKVQWEQGGIASSTGNPYSNANQVRTGFVSVQPNDLFYVTHGVVLWAHEYDAQQSQLRMVQVTSQQTYTVGASTAYVRFRAEHNPASAFAPADVDFTIIGTSNNPGMLKFKQAMVEGESIDNIFASGVYTIYAGTVSSILGTFPSNWKKGSCSIICLATNRTDKRGTVQLLADGDVGNRYLRVHNGSAWNSWVPISSTAGILPQDADINLYSNMSANYSFTGAVAATLSGLPADYDSTKPGVLSVISGRTAAGNTIQVLYSDTNKCWIRYHNNDFDETDSSVGWTDWIWQNTQTQFSTTSRLLIAGDDIDDFSTFPVSGVYVSYAYAISDIDGTWPRYWTKQACSIFHVDSNRDDHRGTIQILSSALNLTSSFIRYHNGLSWEQWIRLSSTAGPIASGEDINTYLRMSGNFSITAATAETLNGLPNSYSGPGVLTVLTGTQEVGRTVQMLTNHLNRMWIRYHNDDYDESDSSVGWRDWSEIATFIPSDYIKRSVTSGFRPRGVPAIYVNGDLTDMSHDTAVPITWYYVTNRQETNPETGTITYYSGTDTSETYTGTMKLQGRGSLNFPKKNYTLKSDTKVDFGWGEQKKYVLKGCWLEPSMASNLTGAKLWGQMANDYAETYPAQLVASPNYGAVDGFGVMLIINGEYKGMFNLNIPKDKWMANMTLDEGTTECIVCSDASTATCGWAALAETLEDLQTGWCLEELSDGIEDDVALRALNQAISAVMTAYTNHDQNWESTVGQYIDIDSAIDYYILRCLIDDRDGMRNNQLLMTYNLVDPETNPATPTKWYFVPYDMDMSFGATNQYYSSEVLYKIGVTRFSVYALNNQLFYLIYNYSRNKLNARYTELRKNQLARRNVYYVLGNLCGNFPAGLHDQEHIIYPITPGDSIFSMEQAMIHYDINCEVCDAVHYVTGE